MPIERDREPNHRHGGKPKISFFLRKKLDKYNKEYFIGRPRGIHGLIELSKYLFLVFPYDHDDGGGDATVILEPAHDEEIYVNSAKLLRKTTKRIKDATAKAIIDDWLQSVIDSEREDEDQDTIE